MSKKGLLGDMSLQEYRYYFDLTGLQRHLKAAGIFCRLLLRDNKSGYLNNILPTLEYVRTVAQQYEEFQWLATWLDNEIIPAIELKLEQFS
jgi:aminoglycoside/choline kinase family phosphotransferase